TGAIRAQDSHQFLLMDIEGDLVERQCRAKALADLVDPDGWRQCLAIGHRPLPVLLVLLVAGGRQVSVYSCHSLFAPVAQEPEIAGRIAHAEIGKEKDQSEDDERAPEAV